MQPALDLHALLRPIAPPAPQRAVVFTGPSLAASEVAQRLPRATVRPPIRRGDLDRAVAEGFEVVGIIDGTYVTERTVGASEVLAALDRGVVVYGAASLGALRAAELHGHGMEGIGVIQHWYRHGITIRDDEVVVAMDPETFAALGEPLINLRYACMRAREAAVIDERLAAALLERYAEIPFALRRYRHLFAALRREATIDLAALERFEAYVHERGDALDLKRRDALALVERIADAHLLARAPAPGPGPGPAAP